MTDNPAVFRCFGEELRTNKSDILRNDGIRAFTTERHSKRPRGFYRATGPPRRACAP